MREGLVSVFHPCCFCLSTMNFEKPADR